MAFVQTEIARRAESKPAAAGFKLEFRVMRCAIAYAQLRTDILATVLCQGLCALSLPLTSSNAPYWVCYPGMRSPLAASSVVGTFHFDVSLVRHTFAIS